jgi:hypothetical protein
MRGGGGTVIAPALRKVFSLMNPGDAVIVLTDGDIFDAGSEETKQLFRKVSAKAGFAMIGYTHTPVDAPGFATTRVTFTEDELAHGFKQLRRRVPSAEGWTRRVQRNFPRA